MSARTQERDRADPAGVSRSGSRPARLAAPGNSADHPGHSMTGPRKAERGRPLQRAASDVPISSGPPD